jgi:CRISPR-associated protein Csx17
VPQSKPKDETKASLLVRCRAELPDAIVPWLDVCFVLGDSGASFFPLLGTGGNDGRLDFTNNFMQRLAEVIPYPADGQLPANSLPWLAAALFADTLVPLASSAVGQFNPGGIGGTNGTQGRFEAGSRVNPWDYVLMIEGALLLGGSIARRLATNSSARAVFPFCVTSVAVGYGSATASEETSDGSRAELWLPLWAEPVAIAEAVHLFTEGRAQLGRHQARNAVEFALAANLLGIGRGITSFSRYGFLKRNGLAFLAAIPGCSARPPGSNTPASGTPSGRSEAQHVDRPSAFSVPRQGKNPCALSGRLTAARPRDVRLCQPKRTRQ